MKKYGLIGNPLGHSFSKGYFNEKFSNENIDAEYVNFEIPTIDDKEGVVRMINVAPPASNTVDRIIDLVPQVMDRVDAFIEKQKN